MSDWRHFTIRSVEQRQDGDYPLWLLRLTTTDMMIQIDRRQLLDAPQPGERVSADFEIGPNFGRIAYGEREYHIRDESEVRP